MVPTVVRRESAALTVRRRLIRRSRGASATGQAVGRGRRVRPIPISGAPAAHMASGRYVADANRRHAGSLISGLNAGTVATTICQIDGAARRGEIIAVIATVTDGAPAKDGTTSDAESHRGSR